MKHICYIYIYEYKCLKDIELVLDCHYNYRFAPEKRELIITKNEEFPTNFWGKNIYSIAAIIGNNGSGKSTAMSLLLDFLVEGSACKSVNGIIVYEQEGNFFYYGDGVMVVFDNNLLKPIDSPIGLKDLKWKISCLYHSGHFTPNINNDPRNSHLEGSYFASDNVRLMEDLQDEYNENVLPMHLPLLQYLNSHVAQNNYRICMMLANRTLSKTIRDFAWPRYVVIRINQSGVSSIENSIRNEKEKVVKEKNQQYTLNDKATIFDNTQVYEDTNYYDELLESYKTDLALYESKLDKHSCEIMMKYDNIAEDYRKRREYDKALEYYEKVLSIKESGVGKHHPDTMMTYNIIAWIYEKMGKYDKALEYYKEVLSIRESLLGKHHPGTIKTDGSIAWIYRKMGEYDKALEYYEEVLSIKESLLGKYHTETATTYNNIAQLYEVTGNYDKALTYCGKALATIKKSKLGKYHHDTAITYNIMAKVYEDKKDYEKVIEYYEKAMDIRKYELDDDNPKTAEIYKSIAELYYADHDYSKALMYYRSALAICQKVGRYQPETAMIHYGISAVYYEMRDYDKALKYCLKALSICDFNLDVKHPLTIATYNNTAKVYYKIGDYNKALEYYKKAMDIVESKFGKHHPDTTTIYNNIAQVYSAMGDYDKALEYYNKMETKSFNPSKSGEDLSTVSIPPFKTVIDPSSKDYFLSQLIYHNLFNIINDKWGWKNGFDIVNEWQEHIQRTIPILDQLDDFINRINDKEKKETLKSLYDVLYEIQNLTTFKNDGLVNGCLLIDCEKNEDDLSNLGEKVLNNNKFYLTSKFFDFSYAQALDSETILSSGEQELLNLFSRLYDAIILRPNKFSDLRSPSLLMLDEAEIGFHPEWQRKYMKLVIEFINALKTIDSKIPDFQIVISTHSPILLSDIPKCCANYLKVDDGKTINANRDEIGETFAANVFNLYRMSFFMEEGLVGEFARGKIIELEKRIEVGEIENVLEEINMIGDEGIREYLLESFYQKHPEQNSINERLIEYYNNKILQLQKGKEYKDE